MIGIVSGRIERLSIDADNDLITAQDGVDRMMCGRAYNENHPLNMWLLKAFLNVNEFYPHPGNIQFDHAGRIIDGAHDLLTTAMTDDPS